MWGLGCSMWDLVPWPGIEPGPPALEAQDFRLNTALTPFPYSSAMSFPLAAVSAWGSHVLGQSRGQAGASLAVDHSLFTAPSGLLCPWQTLFHEWGGCSAFALRKTWGELWSWFQSQLTASQWCVLLSGPWFPLLENGDFNTSLDYPTVVPQLQQLTEGKMENWYHRDSREMSELWAHVCTVSGSLDLLGVHLH